MKTIKIEKDSIELKITLDELKILNNSFKEAVSDLEWEFKIITGYKIEEIEPIFNSIETAIKTGANETEIQFLNEEIRALKQVLGVCSGLKLDNFEEKIGATKQEVKKLYGYVRDLSDLIPRKKPSVRRKSRKALHDYTDFQVRKFCCINSLEYDFCFYMRRMDFAVSKPGYLIALQERGSDKAIVKTKPVRISLEQLHSTIALLQTQVNGFDYVKNTFFCTSFMDETVKINVSNVENVESLLSNSSQEPTVNIEFIFLPNQENSYLKEQKSFTSTTTLDDILEFTTLVEDFVNEVRSHIYTEITYIF